LQFESLFTNASLSRRCGLGTDLGEHGWSFALLLLSSFFRFVVQPIITRRKAEGTWEVDDWELRTKAKIEDNNADEAIVICFDISYGMNDSMGSNWVGNSITKTFRKFDEAKQAFENVIARMVDYHLANHTGLVAFGSRDQIAVRKPLRRVQKGVQGLEEGGLAAVEGC
jgi:hypothetical protein